MVLLKQPKFGSRLSNKHPWIWRCTSSTKPQSLTFRRDTLSCLYVCGRWIQVQVCCFQSTTRMRWWDITGIKERSLSHDSLALQPWDQRLFTFLFQWNIRVFNFQLSKLEDMFIQVRASPHDTRHTRATSVWRKCDLTYSSCHEKDGFREFNSLAVARSCGCYFNQTWWTRAAF